MPERSAGAPARRSLGAGGKRRRSIRILRKMGSDFFKQTPPKTPDCNREFLHIDFFIKIE
ncbi:hypothetical protein A3B21_04045 [Candidatus Uhrbacteria bacterium RIFCSPLOWO2_01_FULL_47_24]|uniref:Uncharacterized protein n=1 Tax=Candidatus Uhrbacteria bacterium RIFCSPLOWO2_01_FULL_47_24 TaxID=1802401 RepID=A0A1F7UT82_9BACT|nr:MAG: hypothetical protein A2753_01190 [Candidatus Uhrbacteria bacterium RIFCSPHIGHO2_01_FULL_47_11]OGL69142.1 MAG: hypothetical protein A3D58_02750 [Candidatus Uhrbacteria bacterium RIFCSPHIGHO2_02_FULL_46_47]OGL74787.1 MAG: hypothetical protein A3F52_04495 [Candidatus Uhrbacteria bacterium RIFCSPHIGHO2_12_FULL_47_11]OGL81513.1 MAG: hypothetical protein A3B21_04045 [Candidatus Uhrbacteria bacterium RIFCSPLOWO2_01_FULL_47_24]OGL83758.1 MAG: hypothetical protein A3J03_01500 [Candidatus Uhrbact